MRKLIYFSLFFVFTELHAQYASLRPGMRITSSVKITPGTYKINKTLDLVSSEIEIEGNNIVVDFSNVVMDGNINNSMPDKFYGVGINIKSGNNITIKNLTAKGYKVALIAKDIKNLTIEHCDFSYNYRQHLNSTQQKEDLSDWMSYHHNEKDEWLRYGAAMYLRGCKKAVVRDNKVTGGQCALMLTECDSGMIYNNNFSFNSGIGIGMYRSSFDTVMYNRLDFNVRGHSEGVYNRGQDAAAILVFEQCNKNVFAFNSATHSGDGFFLWAGQTTMDNGEGGCNENLIFKNDFSYAPTNGIEVTFSSNRISGNKIFECDNAIWGGYSYNTVIKSNEIENCNTGIAIEHGQDNKIEFNWFRKCGGAIKLWARASQPSDWGYANKRDTRSRDYKIGYNSFTDNKIVFDFLRTRRITGIKNDTGRNIIFLKSDTSVSELNITQFTCCDDSFEPYSSQEKSVSNLKSPRRKDIVLDSSLIGRRQIRMTEWGPYDFRYPLIWNTNPVSISDTMQFEIIGPAGNWKIIDHRGVKNITLSNGSTPAILTAVKTNEKGQDIFIELEYVGGDIVTPFGEKLAKGKKYLFNYRNNLLPVEWKVNCYKFDSVHNPLINPGMISELIRQAPVFSETSAGLDYAWWGGVGKEKKYEQFLTVAETDIDFPPGEYEIGASWEDVVRIYIDGKLVLDEWKPVAHVYDESTHVEIPVSLAGKHHVRVEQANQAGFATLIIKLKKK